MVSNNPKIDKESSNVSEEEVVEEIGKLRRGVAGKPKSIPEGSKSLKKDNVSTEEVVEIIREIRNKAYIPYREKTELAKGASPKVRELQDIFENHGRQSDWDNLCLDVMEVYAEETKEDIMDVQDLVGADPEADGKNGARIAINERIISKAEVHPVIKISIATSQEELKWRIGKKTKRILTKNGPRKV